MNHSDHLRMLVNQCREKAGDFEIELEVLREKQFAGKDKQCHFCGEMNFINAVKCQKCKRIF